MKKFFLIQLILLFALSTYAEHNNRQTEFELGGILDENETYVYEASSYIKLLDGFKFSPKKGNSLSALINRYGVFPPESGYFGGPSSSSQDGVVGALPGTLNVNDFGGAVYSIPIQLPKGLGDMTPDLSITYNNQVGNGLLGWAWDISGLSSITRVGCTKYNDGKITKVMYNSDDRFIMDGKRLLLDCPLQYGGNNSTYRTEIDDMSKIVFMTNGNTHDYFVVYKVDGTIWEYGNSADSYVEPQNMSNVAMSWLVNKISDRDGNSIVFHYNENNGTGESYVNHIEYSINEKQKVDGTFDVIFSYENRDDVEELYVYKNMVRKSKLLKNIVVKDTKSGKELFNYSFSYLKPGNYGSDFYGWDYFAYNRLQQICLTADGMKLNPTRVTWNLKPKHYHQTYYTYTLNNQIFNKVPFAGDFNGDGISDVLLVPYKSGNSYNGDVVAEVYINKGNGTFETTPSFSFTFEKYLEWVYIIDINGDGLMDVVPYYFDYESSTAWHSRLDFYLNDGKVKFYEVDQSYFADNYSVFPGDFFGEKKACIYVGLMDNGKSIEGIGSYIIYYADGHCHAKEINNGSSMLYARNVLVEDLDGDGRQEIISIKEHESAITNVEINDGKINCVERYTDYNLCDDDYLFPGDYNGDGNVDIIKYNHNTYWSVLVSDGNKFISPVSFGNANLFSNVMLNPKDKYCCSLTKLSESSIAIRIGDFDGDGKSDVGLFYNKGGNYYMYLGTNFYKKSTGNYDFKATNRYYMPIEYANQYVHIGNFYGRENISILGTVKSSPMYYDIPRIVSFYPHSEKYSVERITDGLGNAHGFAYSYMIPNNGSAYSFEHDWVTDNIRTVCMPLRILKADTVYSINNRPCYNEYSYSNAWYHVNGHGFIGYQRFEIQEYVDGKRTRRKQFNKELKTMGENCMSLPSENLTFDCDDMLSMKENVKYKKLTCNNNPQIVMPLVVSDKKVCYDYGSSKNAIKVEIIESSYGSDAAYNNYVNYVNLVELKVGFCDNPSVNDVIACDFMNISNYSYSNDVNKWIINRLNTSKFVKYAKNEDLIGYTEKYIYSDNTNPLRLTMKKSTPNILWNESDPLTMVTTYVYDKVGNVIEQTVSSPSVNYKRVSKVGYSPNFNYLYPTSMCNEKGWTTEISYNDCFGLSRKSIDYNNFEMDATDDVLGITSSCSMPDGMSKVRTKRWSSGNKHAPSNSMYYFWEKSTGEAEALVFYHKNGCELRNVTFDIDGEPIYVDMTYDNLGNVVSRSLPYSPGDEVKHVYFVYDKYNRIIEEVFPNGIRHEYTYNNMVKTMTTVTPDGRTQTKKEKANVIGWVVESTDIGGNVVSFEYFSDGTLKSSRVGNNADTKISYEYDRRRRKTKQIDPNYGETIYEYDVFGNLIKTISPKNGTVTCKYDETGTLLSRIMDDGSGNINKTQWYYDENKGKIGMLKMIVHDDSSVDYFYDDLLRLVSIAESVDGKMYYTDYEYDKGNKECYITYSSGVKIKKEYSNSGFLKSILDADNGSLLWRTNATDSYGNITDYQVGNGLKTSLGYDDDFMFLNSIYTTKNGCVYQDYTYNYDCFGNLTNRSKFDGKMVSESFDYDEFNRLVRIALNGKTTGSMEYDNLGNMISKTINDVSVFYDAEYDGGPYKLRAAKTDVDNELVTHVVSYNVFDKICTAKFNNTDMTFLYGYDLNRNKVSQVSKDVKFEKVYVNGCEYITENGDDYAYTYLEGPAGVFAVVKTDMNGGKDTYYIHKDHQNSWCVITDDNCDLIQKTSYDAWGNLRDADSWNGEYRGNLLCDRGYTGHEHILALGLINMNGRLYDPIMSMMLSPDNNIQDPYFSQNYNRYRYCYNNPLSYQDPSGEVATWILEGVFWGCVNVISNVDYIDDFGEGLLLFVAGFASGCLTHGVSQCSWAVQVACNVGASIMKAGINNFVKQNDGSYDWSIIDESDFRESVMFAMGSSLASSTLNAYIVQPTDTDPGLCLGSLICKGYKEGHILDTTLSGFMGNLFAQKVPLYGFDFSSLDLDWDNVLADVVDALEIYFPDSKLISILGSIEGMVGLFAGTSNGTSGGTSSGDGGSKAGNIVEMSVISPVAKSIGIQNMNAPVCYSSVRSLFLN